MGASPSPDEPRSVPAAIMSTTTPEVSVEEAAESDESAVFVEGTMYHSGLNKNAWGLTEAGADAIAEDLIGVDYTASHPPVRGTKYDRSIAEGQGMPIGEVVETEVVSVEGAAIDGGEYVASYRAKVTDPVFSSRIQAGQFTKDGYGTSVGIYADPESASCSVCGEQMQSDDCDHRRGEEVRVESDDGEEEVKTAGPLYDDGDTDHLAHVWRPAYEGADAEVAAEADADAGAIAQYSAESAGQVPLAAEVLGAPHGAVTQPTPAEAAETAAAGDADDDTDSSQTAPDAPRSRGYAVQVAETTPHRRRDRGSYPVQLNDDRR